MIPNLDDIRSNAMSMTDEELVEIVSDQRNDFTAEAIRIYDNEVESRGGLKSMEQAVSESNTKNSSKDEHHFRNPFIKSSRKSWILAEGWQDIAMITFLALTYLAPALLIFFDTRIMPDWVFYSGIAPWYLGWCQAALVAFLYYTIRYMSKSDTAENKYPPLISHIPWVITCASLISFMLFNWWLLDVLPFEFELVQVKYIWIITILFLNVAFGYVKEAFPDRD